MLDYHTLLDVPLAAAPSQVVTTVLAQQRCRIAVYEKSTGLFLDLYVNDALVIGGVSCLNSVKIVRDAYLGFTGDLLFYDTQEFDDPVASGLGKRFALLYLQ